MPGTVYLGMAVSSHSTEQAAQAQFIDFGEVTGGSIGQPELTGEPLGPSSRRTGLVISEIMYHPPSRMDGRQLEFVELYNSQPFFEEIGGWRLSGALDFTFPPGTVLPAGGFILVARVPADVQAVYGIPNVLGGYTNVLQNSTGTIRLRNHAGAVLLEARYNEQSTLAGRGRWRRAFARAGASLLRRGQPPGVGRQRPQRRFAWHRGCRPPESVPPCRNQRIPRAHG